jgi:hypothetical protein
MSKQPDALRLADWCAAHSSGVYRPSAEAAAELRRLHALNAELVEALNDVFSLDKALLIDTYGNELVRKWRAALAKATP